MKVWQHLTRGLQTVIGISPADDSGAVLSKEWQVLGPFQIGTREAIWGADPLEHLGGFRALEYSKHETYRSSLGFNGTVNWSLAKAKNVDRSEPSEYGTTTALDIAFPDIDWRFLQDVYGWAALQWQGWARGEIDVRSEDPVTYSLFLENILEVWVDDEHFFGGDFYGFQRAPLTLRLKPGKHRIDVRLVRDVRAMGGVGRPDISVKLRLAESAELLQPLYSSDDGFGDVLVSDVFRDIYGPLNTPHASATVRNDARKDIYVVSMEADPNSCESELVNAPIKLVPGQSRPLPFRIGCIPPVTGRGPVPIQFNYKIDGEDEIRTVTFSAWPIAYRLEEPQKITYMHPGGIVSYAVLRPPHPELCKSSKNESLPILLQLHGAGLEAEDDLVREALDSVPDLCAWVLFPTGVTPWSGDDWHNWGFTDVEAAIAAIPQWMEDVEWNGPGVDLDRWMVSGHSNGGQGAWYTMTHRPDKVFAATAVSGYSSIQNYVPYTFWQTADPGRTAVVQAALNSYKHELLLENVKDIPLLIQHGSNDDNVPAYHARMMNEKLQQFGVESTLVEVPKKPHWWDGVMTTEPLAAFYREHLNRPGPGRAPIKLESFTAVSANNGDSGPKNGVQILALNLPGQIGKVHITFDPITLACTFFTRNVAVFIMPLFLGDCQFVTVNGQDMTHLKHSTSEITLSNKDGEWKANTLPPVTPRYGRQLGAIDSVLRTQGAFQIVQHSPSTSRIAVQVSRNLFQYFAADSIISEDFEKARTQTEGNIISIAIGEDLPPLVRQHQAIKIIGDRLQIEDSNGHLRQYASRPDGLAAVFLRPLLGQRLELVVWAADEESLDIAARLVPMMTGTGIPDLVVADRSMLAKGIEGAIALGFFGDEWEVTRNSFFA